jgi:hypothetical protein
MSTDDPRSGRDPVAASHGADYSERQEETPAEHGVLVPYRRPLSRNHSYMSIVAMVVGIPFVVAVIALLILVYFR